MKNLIFRRSGFTLIEMMIVVLIVVILAGLVFRMVGAIGKGNDIAETRAKIEMISNALEEFKAIYGKYPPVPYYNGSQKIGYEYPVEKTWGADSTDGERVAKLVINANHGTLAEWGGICTVYTFGLASFFIPRYNGTAERGPKAFCGVNASTHKQSGGVMQWTQFNSRVNGKIGDSDRDLNAVRRILPMLGGKLGPDNRVANGGCISWWESVRSHPLYENVTITNANATFADAWRREMHYISRPPYETYRLWSNGPDGVSGTEDDIVSGAE